MYPRSLQPAGFEQVDANPPPSVAGAAALFKKGIYITQAKARPPSFVMFAPREDYRRWGVPTTSYLRYLTNSCVSEAFDLPGKQGRREMRRERRPKSVTGLAKASS